MKRIVGLVLGLALLTAGPAFAVTDWYACSGAGAMSTRTWYSAPGTETVDCTCVSPTGLLTWDTQVAGDKFYANGCTAIAVDVDPQGTGGSKGKVTLTTAAGIGRAGGGFTLATATGPATTLMDITAGTTICLAVSGSSGAWANTGNVLGGSAATCHGVNDTHTAITVYNNGTITGGSFSSARGWSWNGANGSISQTGNVTGATGDGLYLSSNGSATVAGDCIGNDTGTSSGCNGTGAGTITVTGNIVHGTRGSATAGSIVWAPSTVSKYVEYKGGTAVYASKAPSTTKVLTDTSVVNAGTGAYEAGTATGGGGAWGF